VRTTRSPDPPCLYTLYFVPNMRSACSTVTLTVTQSPDLEWRTEFESHGMMLWDASHSSITWIESGWGAVSSSTCSLLRYSVYLVASKQINRNENTYWEKTNLGCSGSLISIKFAKSSSILGCFKPIFKLNS